MRKPRRILVTHRLQRSRERRQELCDGVGGRVGATLHVLQVIPDPLAMGLGVDAAYLPQLLERTERNVREQLEASLTPQEREKFHVESGRGHRGPRRLHREIRGHPRH
jgi:hypothetical protein